MTNQKEELSMRHQDLINRKHMGGLNVAETEELARIERELERLEAPFYETILARLRGEDK